jgi:hypothetical protein
MDTSAICRWVSSNYTLFRFFSFVFKQGIYYTIEAMAEVTALIEDHKY